MTTLAHFIVTAWLVMWAASAALAFAHIGRIAWRYALMLGPFWLVFVVRYPLSFVAVKWFSSDDNLTFPFRWLDTVDNYLTGDEGWKSEHLWGTDPNSYMNKVRWLWRNGGNRFNYRWIGVSDSAPPTWAFWNKTAIPLVAGRFLDLRFGWSPEGPKEGRRKYVFTIRIKTKP